MQASRSVWDKGVHIDQCCATSQWLFTFDAKICRNSSKLGDQTLKSEGRSVLDICANNISFANPTISTKISNIEISKEKIMKTLSIFGASAFLAVLFATQAVATDADIKKALAGKTIVNEGSEFKLRKNGGLTGKAGPKRDVIFKGAWAIRDGKWCRTFSEPESFAGTECQTLVLGDGTVTITGRSGPQTWEIK